MAALHRQLLDQLDRFVTSSDWEAFLALASRFHSYSANNCMLILVQRPTATRVASHSTWRTLGRHVRRGERGIAILAPCHYPSTDLDGDDHPRIRGFKVVHVFDVAQTDGAPLPDGHVGALLEGEAPRGMWDAIAALVARDGYRVDRRDCGAANGYTDRGARIVAVAPELSDAAAVKTLVHELAHVRQSDAHLEDTSRAQCEVEAESVAYVVCQAFGLASASFSLGYVASWAGGDVSVVRATASWVVREAHAIINEASILAPASD